MGLPRSKYVQEGEEGVYHCFSRCVRRAYLYGHDALTGRDFSHRKKWIVDRLKYLAAVFAIEVCAYAVMENHYHSILRTRPDIVAIWSDYEVATRWLTLFPKQRGPGGAAMPPAEEDINALMQDPERIAELRKRLCSLSWFMGRLNEFIARAANKEDKVKGRFWESRFKCQALLDEAAIAACMVYVDLNPIRAGLASTPEESDFTSIQERIRAWQKDTMATTSAEAKPAQDAQHKSLPANIVGIPKLAFEGTSALSSFLDSESYSTSWLCPISSDARRRGILRMTALEYFELVDESGRMTRSDKRGAVDADMMPILIRIGANPEAWLETVSRFGSGFRLAAGRLPNLRNFACHLGRRWLKGISTARVFFASSEQLS